VAIIVKLTECVTRDGIAAVGRAASVRVFSDHKMAGGCHANHLHFPGFALGQRAHLKVAKDIPAINVSWFRQSLAETIGNDLILVSNPQDAVCSNMPDHHPGTVHDAHPPVQFEALADEIRVPFA